MIKIPVSKENYENVRKIEEISKRKIKEIYAPVVDCVDGQWGLWNIQRCYRSFNGYIAEVVLEKKAKDQKEAITMWKILQTLAAIEMEKGNPYVGKFPEL